MLTEADTAQSMPDLWRSQQAEQRVKRPGSADLLMNEFSHEENGQMNGLDNGSEFSSEMKPGSQDFMTIPIVKGGMGFGFTIADSAYGTHRSHSPSGGDTRMALQLNINNFKVCC